MSEPKSLLVDTRQSGVHYFDVLTVMSWLAVILCNVLVRIINIHTALISQEIGCNFRSEKSVQAPPQTDQLRDANGIYHKGEEIGEVRIFNQKSFVPSLNNKIKSLQNVMSTLVNLRIYWFKEDLHWKLGIHFADSFRPN